MGLQADRRVQQRHAGSNRIVYWNALESTENNNAGIAAEFASVAVNDQSRALDFDPADPFASRWSNPSPVDGGATPPPVGSPQQPSCSSA